MTPARQREIFRDLVSCQDAGMPVQMSRTRIAAYFSISVEAVMDIEALGLTGCWPPLDET